MYMYLFSVTDAGVCTCTMQLNADLVTFKCYKDFSGVHFNCENIFAFEMIRDFKGENVSISRRLFRNNRIKLEMFIVLIIPTDSTMCTCTSRTNYQQSESKGKTVHVHVACLYKMCPCKIRLIALYSICARSLNIFQARSLWLEI